MSAGQFADPAGAAAGWAPAPCCSRSKAGSSYGCAARRAATTAPRDPRAARPSRPALSATCSTAPTAPIGRVGAGERAEGAARRSSSRRNARSRRAVRRRPRRARRSSAARRPTGTKTTSLSSVVVGLRVERAHVAQAEPGGERVGDARRRRRRRWCGRRSARRRRGSCGAPARPWDRRPARRAPPPSSSGWWVSSSCAPAVDRLGHRGRHGVDGEQHALDRLVRVAADQPHGVPRLGPRRVEPALERRDQLAETGHAANLPVCARATPGAA